MTVPRESAGSARVRPRAWWRRQSLVARAVVTLVGVVVLAGTIYWVWFGIYVLVTTIHGPTAD